MNHNSKHADSSIQRYNTLVESLTNEIQSAEADCFIEFCSARVGYEEPTTRSMFVEQVVPFVALQESSADVWVPSAGVGTLIELAREFGPPGLQSIAQAIEEPVGLSNDDYLDRYEATRQLLVNRGCSITEECWPSREAIGLAGSYGYKGCPEHNKESYPYDSLDSPTSDQSSS